MYVPKGSPLPNVDVSKSAFFEIEALGDGDMASLKVESCQAKKANQIWVVGKAPSAPGRERRERWREQRLETTRSFFCRSVLSCSSQKQHLEEKQRL